MCGGKEKKRMIRQMLNWKTVVVLAYNGGHITLGCRLFDVVQPWYYCPALHC